VYSRKLTTKVTALFLVMIMAISMLPISAIQASATTGAQLTIDVVTGIPGETVELKAVLSNAPDVKSMAVSDITYDSGKMTLTKVEWLCDAEIKNWNSSQGRGVLTFGENTNANGAILKMTFKIADIVEDSDVNVSCSIIVKAMNASHDEEPVATTVIPGVVEIRNEIPGDMDGNEKVNSDDAVYLLYHTLFGKEEYPIKQSGDIDGNSKTDSNDAVYLLYHVLFGEDDYPFPDHCVHSLDYFAEKAATCTGDGNEAYWYCSKCGKYFADANRNTEISLVDTVIAAKGHTYSDQWSSDQTYHWHASTCEHTNLVKDKAEHIYGNDNICDICLAVNTPDPSKPYKITYELYEYDENKGDTYLPTAHIVNHPKNRAYYSSTDSFDVENPTCAGYEFLGWFTVDGEQINRIDVGTNKNLRLQARWKPIEYDIVYRLFKTPIEDTIEEKYKTYTVNKGLVDMPNPDIYNYVFLGWYTDDGVEVTNIPIGTTDDIALNAFFVSKRNLAKPVATLGDPIILENTDEGIIYFAYELGTIENVPLDTLEIYDNIVGLKQIASKEYEWSVSSTRGEEITETISKATVDSGTWSWSENWSDVLEVSEEWAEEHGMTQSEAKEAIKTTTDGYSTSYSESGQKGTTETDGTTTLNYDSTNTTDLEGVETKVEFGVTASTKVNAGFMKGKWEVSANGGISNKNSTETNKHTGTDTTSVNTTVTESSSSWNDEATSEHSEQLSTSESVTNAISEIISNTKGYGKSYAKGGEGSKSFDKSASESNTSSASSTVTFTNAESKKTTTTIEIDAETMKEGSYRLTIGGTMHVFAVVGYDIANKSYFHYTYNVMDDAVKTFFDYSCDGSFSDHEYSVLPFEVPYFVHEYVSSKIAVTEGVRYQTNSTTGTAKILKYEGNSPDVLIPTYISAGGTAYKVTEIAPTAFARNTSIKTVILSEYIDEIPAGAFKNCTSLEEISGFYSKIGAEAFSGCTNLKSFAVSSAVSEIGTNAFTGVEQISVTALNADRATAIAKSMAELNATEAEITATAQVLTQKLVSAAVNSGADSIVLNVSDIVKNTKLNIEVPEITRFELNGGGKIKTYYDMAVSSKAQTTKLNELIIHNSPSYSINIKSEEVLLNAVSITSDGTSLALSSDGSKVYLYRDTRLVSNSTTTIVCKNATFNSQTVESVEGTLDVSGNIYVVGENGNVTETSCPYFVTITNGEIIAIEEGQFEGFVKGSSTITYNANGGIVYIPSTTVIYGEEIAEMPIPEWDGYTFLGWFDENGTEVVVGDVFNYSSDITLRAHWKSSHVLQSELPDDAEIVAGSEKWTYDLTTNITSDQVYIDGYTLYDTTSIWGEYGAWSEWSTTEAVASDSREVETNSVAATYKTQYNYSRWTQYANGTGHNGPWEGAWSGIWCGNYKEKGWSDSPLSVYSNAEGFPMYGSAGNTWYNQTTRQVEVTPAYTEYRYRDRELIYTYYHTKTETMESATEVAETESISNVKKWVQYIVD